MTRKDYEAVAGVLARQRKIGESFDPIARAQRDALLYVLTSTLADLFARDNPRFDRQKFYAATGVQV
jgi:hypothetical protein